MTTRVLNLTARLTAIPLGNFRPKETPYVCVNHAIIVLIQLFAKRNKNNLQPNNIIYLK